MRTIVKEIYIIRHGQTELNAQGIVQGKGINSPLNEFGRKQAAAFYEAYKHVNFDVAYTSSLLRAQETASGFVKAGVPHVPDSDLDEISWGDVEGNSGFTDNSELFEQLLGEWKSGNFYYKFPGGESPFEMQQRQISFLEKLKASPYKTVLIATHGRYIRAFMCTITGRPLSDMDEFDHANLCLYKINLLSDGTFEIEQHNNQAHLAELMGL
jgi:broad specificity phosphatase PhoE